MHIGSNFDASISSRDSPVTYRRHFELKCTVRHKERLGSEVACYCGMGRDISHFSILLTTLPDPP